MSSTSDVFGRRPSVGLAGRRFDNVFFFSMALLLLATVFLGFAHSYYLAGIFRAPLPSLLVHIHGAVFSCWILLFITQICLVSVGRVDIHRRVGIAGFLLACLMVVLGAWVATAQLVRHTADPIRTDAKLIDIGYIVALTDLLIFATLIFFAFRARSNPAAHKRLILIATIALTQAATGRWPVAVIHSASLVAAWPFLSFFVQFAFLLPVVAYDLWSTRRIHRATLWASAFLVFLQVIKIPIGLTNAWHAFATWMVSVAS
jgi:hypothetical protein